jgi:acyl carrier protein
VDDVNLQLPADGRLEKSLQEVLVGEKSKLDSLGMVNFLVAVEEKLEAELGCTGFSTPQTTSCTSVKQKTSKIVSPTTSSGNKHGAKHAN